MPASIPIFFPVPYFFCLDDRHSVFDFWLVLLIFFSGPVVLLVCLVARLSVCFSVCTCLYVFSLGTHVTDWLLSACWPVCLCVCVYVPILFRKFFHPVFFWYKVYLSIVRHWWSLLLEKPVILDPMKTVHMRTCVPLNRCWRLIIFRHVFVFQKKPISGKNTPWVPRMVFVVLFLRS